MSEVGADLFGGKRSREFMDVMERTVGDDVSSRLDAIDEAQRIVGELSMEEIIAIEDFVAELQRAREQGDEVEYTDDACRRAVANMKWGMNMRTSEYLKGIVYEAGLSDKVLFHRLSFAHDERESGREIAVYMVLDFTVRSDDFKVFLEYVGGIEGVRVENDPHGSPYIVFPVEKLMFGTVGEEEKEYKKPVVIVDTVRRVVKFTLK